MGSWLANLLRRADRFSHGDQVNQVNHFTVEKSGGVVLGQVENKLVVEWPDGELGQYLPQELVRVLPG